MTGQKYFQVDVSITQESANGKYKKHVERYLTLAYSVTEAEANVVHNFETIGDIRDYRVKAVSETKIVDVVPEAPAQV